MRGAERGRPARAEPWVWHETGVVQQGQQSSLVSFVEVGFAQGLHDEGILLFAHELGQRLGQGAPVALFTQGVQQDPRQVLGRHLEEREGSDLGTGWLFPDVARMPSTHLPTKSACLAKCCPPPEAYHSTPRSPSSTEVTHPCCWPLTAPA